MVDRPISADEELCETDDEQRDGDATLVRGRDDVARKRPSNLSRKGVVQRLVGGIAALILTLGASAAIVAYGLEPIEWRLLMIIPMLPAALGILQAVEKT